MYFTNSIISSAILLGFASQSMGASLRRQTPATCAQSQVGYLALVSTSAPSPEPFTYAGIVSGVTHSGIDGDNVSTLNFLRSANTFDSSFILSCHLGFIGCHKR